MCVKLWGFCVALSGCPFTFTWETEPMNGRLDRCVCVNRLTLVNRLCGKDKRLQKLCPGYKAEEDKAALSNTGEVHSLPVSSLPLTFHGSVGFGHLSHSPGLQLARNPQCLLRGGESSGPQVQGSPCSQPGNFPLALPTVSLLTESSITTTAVMS